MKLIDDKDISTSPGARFFPRGPLHFVLTHEDAEAFTGDLTATILVSATSRPACITTTRLGSPVAGPDFSATPSPAVAGFPYSYRTEAVRIGGGALLITDDGAGAFQGSVDGGGTNTIDYATGEYDLSFSEQPVGNADVNLVYVKDPDDYGGVFMVGETGSLGELTVATASLPAQGASITLEFPHIITPGPIEIVLTGTGSANVTLTMPGQNVLDQMDRLLITV